MTTVKLFFNSGDQPCLKKKSINRLVLSIHWNSPKVEAREHLVLEIMLVPLFFFLLVPLFISFVRFFSKKESLTANH